KESTHGRFYGGCGFVIPIKANDRKLPVAGRRHPDVLDRTGSFHLSDGERLARVDDNERVYLPSHPKFICFVGSICHVALALLLDWIGHSALPLFAGKVFRADRPRL